MEVLVEEYQVTPVGVVLKFLYAPVNSPAPAIITQKDVGQAMREFCRYLLQCQQVT